MSNYDYLDLGTIWKSKRKGTLVSVIGLANFDLPEKYHKTNPPQVVFTDGTFIFSSDVKRFLSLRTFVRLDEGLKNSLLELFSAPITEEEEDPSLYLEDDEEDDDLLLSPDEENEDDVSTAQHVYAQASTESESKAEHKLEASVQQSEKPLCTLTIETEDSEKEFSEKVEKHFYGYDQSRNLEGVFYHKLSFDTRDAVEYLLKNIDAVAKMTVNVDGVNINIDVNYITTIYPSVLNVSLNNVLHSVYSYNVIVAEVPEENDDAYEENDSSEPSTPVVAAKATETAETAETAKETSAAATVETIIPEVVEDQPTEYTLGDILNEASAAFDAALAKNDDIPMLEQISINAQQDSENLEDIAEDEEEFSNVEELSEEPKEEDLTNAEEISDQELLASSIVMPSDSEEELVSSDPVSDSLASKLEVITSEDTENAPSLIEESLKDTVEDQQDEINLIEENPSEEDDTQSAEEKELVVDTEEKKEE